MQKKKFRLLVFIFWSLALCRPGAADTILLVHGYLGSGESWRSNGIGTQLQRNGWQDAGHLRVGPYGVRRFGPANTGQNRFVTVGLPTEAPILFQAAQVAHYLKFLRDSFASENIVLVGHSAGGVVARATLVRFGSTKVKGLITIASPHLGTQIAKTGRAIGNSPLGWLAPFFGGSTINRSQALYHDLSPENPGNLVGWLNRQPHPDITYVSIIRAREPGAPARGDRVSMAFQQDMNSAPALRGRAKTIVAPGSHLLNAGDGRLILTLARQILAPKEGEYQAREPLNNRTAP